MLVGVLVIVRMTTGDKWLKLYASPFHELMIPVVGTTTIVLTGVVLGSLGHYAWRRSGRGRPG